MPTHALEDARGAQWRKLIFNASTNAIGALTGLTHGRVCERPTCARWPGPRRRGQGGRGRRRASTLDADPGGAVRLRGAHGGRLRPQAVDAPGRRGRRPTEIDFLNGAIVRFGREDGVADAAQRARSALVKGVEASMDAELSSRALRARARGARARRARRGARLRHGVHRLRGRRHLPLGLPDRPPLRLRPGAGRRRAGDRLPAPRRARSATTATRGCDQVFADRPGEWLADRLRGQRDRCLRARLRADRARLPRARGRGRARRVGRAVRPRACRQVRGRARLRAGERRDQRRRASTPFARRGLRAAPRPRCSRQPSGCSSSAAAGG